MTAFPFDISSDRTRPSIFVAIPSYRDAETEFTVADLYAKAHSAERITVGICWQFDPASDAPCFTGPIPRPGQTRLLEVPCAATRGANWARAQALSLRRDEPYVLLIDAHMRFEPGWDNLLLDLLAQCPSPQPVLTTYPMGYTRPDDCDRSGIKRIAFREFTNEQPPKLRYRAIRVPNDSLPPAPFLTASVSHGFIFAPAQLFDSVPIDPHIYFFGDEMTFAARAWTHGWDFYSPHVPVLYHLWDRDTRPRHGQDRPRDASPLRRASAARVAHLVGIERTSDPNALVELERYGLGTARSMADYQRFSGVDFERRTLSARALTGVFDRPVRVPAPSVGPRPRIFVAIRSYRDAETQWTVKDLFDKAACPDRVFVGICWQVDPAQDAHCFVEPYPRPEQVRVAGVLASQTRGACWAYEQALALARDEEYVFLIDSHLRFEPGWDETLIELLHATQDARAVLTAWMPGYEPPATLQPPAAGTVRRIAVKKFTEPEHPAVVHLTGILAHAAELAPVNPTPFLVGGFIFTRATTFAEVPIDPHIHMYGEEIEQSARLWTHGYTIYEPAETIAYHYWKPRGTVIEYKRPTHPGAVASNRRVRGLLGLADGAARSRTAGRYGLGTIRSLDSLWQFARIDPAARLVTDDAARAQWDHAWLRTGPATPPSRAA